MKILENKQKHCLRTASIGVFLKGPVRSAHYVNTQIGLRSCGPNYSQIVYANRKDSDQAQSGFSLTCSHVL